MPLTQEQLDNAGLDADSFGSFVNGNSGVTVTTRTGQTYPSVARIVSKLESGFYAAPTWTALAAFDATGMVAGQAAKVFGPDAGTHTDPVVGGTVPNVGIYARSTSPAGWQRIAGLEADDAEAWAEGTEPGGPGTFSAKEWAESLADIGDSVVRQDIPEIAVSLEAENGSVFAVRTDGSVINKNVQEIEADIKQLQITAVSAPVGDADTSVLALAQLLHFIVYGQSLSMGQLGTPPISTSAKTYAKKFTGGVRTTDGSANYPAYYASLANLTETAVSPNGETISSGMAQTLFYLLQIEDGITLDGSATQVPMFSAPGAGGLSAAQLASGTAPFTRLEANVDNAQLRANDSYGSSYQVAAMPYLQGEQDYTLGTAPATWRATVLGIRSDAEEKGQDVSGVIRPLPMILYQLAQHIAKATDPTLAMEAVDMAKTEALVGLATPMYHFDYVDTAHLLPESYFWLGCYFGWFAKRWLWDGLKVPPLDPVEEVWHDYGVMLRFRPDTKLVFDTVQVTDPGDYGFALMSADESTTYSATVAIRGSDWVEIRSSDPIGAGARLRYAWYTDDPVEGATHTGRLYGARGCLRDNHGDRIAIKSPTGVIHPLHRWAPIFERVRP